MGVEGEYLWHPRGGRGKGWFMGKGPFSVERTKGDHLEIMVYRSPCQTAVHRVLTKGSRREHSPFTPLWRKIRVLQKILRTQYPGRKSRDHNAAGVGREKKEASESGAYRKDR